jgi:predicted dehydrogenase
MTLRAGVLGLGVMGRHHSRVLNNLEGVDFLGVYDPADSVGPLVEGKPVFKGLDEFLDLGFDYCVVAAPTVYHLDIGKALAERGIHALIEKPVASTTEAATELCDLFVLDWQLPVFTKIIPILFSLVIVKIFFTYTDILEW